MAITKDARAYGSSSFVIQIDGTPAGWVYGFDGGMAQGEVVSEKMGPDDIIHKHVSGIRYEDITVQFGTSVSKKFRDWILKSFTKDYQRKTGALVQANFNYKEIARLDFSAALVSEFTLPALDANSKEPAKLTVKISPEYSRWKAEGKEAYYPQENNAQKQKQWLCRNFRLSMDDKSLDGSRVSKVESLSLKQKVVEVPLGEMRDPYKEPVATEYSNLVLTLPESHAEGWHDWYNHFVIKGECGADNEKTGQLEFLTEDLKTVATVHFRGLGIFKLTPDKTDSNSSDIRKVKVEMYCESFTIDFTDSAVGA